MHELLANALFKLLEAFNSNGAVRGTGERQNGINQLLNGVESRKSLPLTGVHHAVLFCQLLELRVHINGHSLGSGTKL